MVDFVLSQHAIERMGEQGITEAMIDAVLTDPRWSPATTRNTRYDGLTADGRRLCVVVAEEWARPVIVTAFWQV